MSTTPQSTSITITWTQPEGDVVDYYEITYFYQGPCPGVTQSETVNDTQTEIGPSSGDMRQFTAADLHEFSNYKILIIGSNAGISPPFKTTVTTLPDGMMYSHGIFYIGLIHKLTSTAPSGPPQSLTVTSTTPFSITIQWGEVECLEQNSEITGYSVRYETRGMTANVTGASNRTFTATGLTPRTNYTFEVAAVSDSGTGPYEMVTIETTIAEGS